jgi:hypothetical protein
MAANSSVIRIDGEIDYIQIWLQRLKIYRKGFNKKWKNFCWDMTGSASWIAVGTLAKIASILMVKRFRGV